MRSSTPRRLPSPAFWAGKRVLVTGHTGFKGSWLTAWLTELGAQVAGLSLPHPPTVPSLWETLGLTVSPDIRSDIGSDEWQGSATEFDPHTIIHLAAQPLVAEGFDAPYRTHATNVLGTAKLMEALQGLHALEGVLVATTDKVYDSSTPAPYDESSRLGGTDPYSASKVGAELVVHSWPRLPCPVVTARAGNVIGGGDWGRQRLIPDLVRSWSSGSAVQLRRPQAVRPWQHVMEPLCGYLAYLEELVDRPTLAGSLNFGPSVDQSVPVQAVVDHAAREWARALDLDAVPLSVSSGASELVETANLTIDSTQAHDLLGWESTLGWRKAVSLTIDWYAAQQRGRDAAGLLREQLRGFTDPGVEVTA